MKCKNCKHDIRELGLEWFHYEFKQERHGNLIQKHHHYFKIAFSWDDEECKNPEPKIK